MNGIDVLVGLGWIRLHLCLLLYLLHLVNATIKLIRIAQPLLAYICNTLLENAKDRLFYMRCSLFYLFLYTHGLRGMSGIFEAFFEVFLKSKKQKKLLSRSFFSREKP